MSTIPLAVQMYTLRDQTKMDFTGPFRRVAEMGYDGVELAGHGTLQAREMRDLLEELGLRPAGSHESFQTLLEEPLQIIDYNLEIGNPYLVVSSLPEQWRDRAYGFRKAADEMNKIGDLCREHELRFMYHNHSFEFADFEGKNGLDILIEHTEPELVSFEIDTYWVVHGGQEPVAYMKRCAERCPLIHLKDMADDEARSFAEVGQGTLDFDAILEAGNEVGVEWYIVEQDICKGDPFESIQISLDYLRDKGLGAGG